MTAPAVRLPRIVLDEGLQPIMVGLAGENTPTQIHLSANDRDFYLTPDAAIELASELLDAVVSLRDIQDQP